MRNRTMLPHPKRLPTLPIVALLILEIVIFAFPANGFIQEKKAFKAFLWAQDPGSSDKNGCYGYNQIDSITTSSNVKRYLSSFWLPTYSWWHQLFTGSYIKTEITTYNGIPTEVSQTPAHYSTVEWITGFKKSDSDSALRFFFPLLPDGQQYGKYDYFTVDVDSLCALKFYGAGDSIMVGTFVHKKPDSRGAVDILGRNAFIVELTNANPFRIKSIRCNNTYDSLLTIFLGYPLNSFKKNAVWYGIDIIDTTSNAPKISIHSVKINGSSPYTSGTSHLVSWIPENADDIDSFVVYRSLDNRDTWTRVGKTTADTFNLTMPEKASDSASIKVTAFGVHGERISSVSSLFSITQRIRFALSVKAYTAEEVVAEWNPSALTIPDARSLWIAFRNGSIVNSFSEEDFDTIEYNLTKTIDTITGLDKSGKYYFTAFVENSSGVYIKANDDPIDSTEARDLTPPENNYALDTASVDSISISLNWNSGEPVNKEIDSVGIWYSKTSNPDVTKLSASSKLGIWKAGEGTATIKKLPPDTRFYIALFAVDKNGNWADATDESRLTIRTRPSEDGKITGQVDTLVGDKTASLFSGNLSMQGVDIEIPYIDTVDEWDTPSLKGLIPASTAYSFRYGKLPAGASVKFSVASEQPEAPFSDNDLALYTFNTDNGRWYLDTAATLKRTSAGDHITFTLHDIRSPFIVMIDTTKPVLKLTRKDTSACQSDTAVEFFFTLSDNIRNPSLQMFSGEGAANYAPINRDFLITLEDDTSYLLKIPASSVSGCYGLRGMVIADDGRNRDTLCLSRRVIRKSNNCDDIATDVKLWTPILVTATPETSSIEGLMKNALGTSKYSYNNRSEAIIRWHQKDADDKGKWLEYSKDSSSSFKLAPGKLFWIRSKRRTQLSYGTATVPLLTDTISITLKKGIWTDFSIPFNFNIYSGDITGATEDTTSLRLYKWSKSSKTGKYSTKALFLQGIENNSDPLEIFSGKQAFTAKNNSDEDIILRIPPTPTVHSSLPDALKKRGITKIQAKNAQWWVKINFMDNSKDIFAESYVARTPSGSAPQWYDHAPSFSHLSASVINPDDGKAYAHAATGSLSEGGVRYNLRYDNNSEESDMITAAIASSGNLPTGVSAVLYCKNDRSVVNADTIFSTTISPRQKNTGYLIIGSDAYIKKTILALNSTFSFLPITFNGALKINYSLPPGVKTMTVSLFDLKGRLVKEIFRNSGLLPGRNSMLIPRQFATGYYVVRMRITLTDHNKLRTLNKRWLYVR